MKKTYKLGKCDGNGNGNGRKINLCEFVYELKDTAKGPVFTMSANMWNHIHSDIIMGGQCCDEVLKYFPRDKQAARMVEIWRQYHLNDTHPECEHQRELGWREMAAEEIDTSEYCLNSTILNRQNALQESSLKRLADGKTVKLDEDAAFVLSLPYFTDKPENYMPDAYKLYKSKTEQRGWVSFEKDDRGLLCKPCPVCGYKYGNAWQYMPIPADVIEEIKSW